MPTLPELGEMLYGPRWQAPLADALGINRRTVQRWAAGAQEPPPAIMAKLLALLDEHHDKAGRMLAKGPR